MAEEPNSAVNWLVTAGNGGAYRRECLSEDEAEKVFQAAKIIYGLARLWKREK